MQSNASSYSAKIQPSVAPTGRREAPLERGYPIVGITPNLLMDPPRTLERIARKHSHGVVRINLGAAQAYLISHPDHIGQVLHSDWKSFRKGKNWDALRRLIGTSFALANDEEWVTSRRRVQPIFVANHLPGLAELMAKEVSWFIDRNKSVASRGDEVDIFTEMMELTSATFLAALFSTLMEQGEALAVTRAVSVAIRIIGLHQFFWFLPAWIPLPKEREFLAAKKTIDDYVWGIVRERRRQGGDHSDLLSILIRACDGESDTGTDDVHLKDELVMLFVGGHQTIATALSWFWYLVDRNPHVYRKLKAEVDSVLEGRTPTHADLGKLQYTKQALSETLRLYPSAWFTPRTSNKDGEIGGFHVAAESSVLISPYVTHRNADFWPDPEVFDPERFAPDKVASRPQHAYIPFGAGPRACIGRSFGLMEMTIVIAMILQKYRPRLIAGHPVDHQAGITLRPRYGLRMTLEAV